MKTINPYKRFLLINLIFGIIGVLGTLALVGNLVFDWQLGHFSFSVYPIFLIHFYQYFQIKKKYIRFSDKKIEWNFITNVTPKSINFSENSIEISSNWKGVSVKNGEQEYEISLDGI